MRLSSRRVSGSPDGELYLVNKENSKWVSAADIVPSLREALENWNFFEPKLKKRSQALEEASVDGISPLMPAEMLSALPRTWLFADGSAFIHHIKLVRMARKAPLPETLHSVPLMYQGECGRFLSPTEGIPQRDFSHGTDFEGEVGVITDFVPMGIKAEEALNKIRLIVLINDVSLRGLIPEELAQGFGFFQSKPASALSPIALTPDELGEAWSNGRVHLPLQVRLNGEFFGRAQAGEMHFHFGQLIAHAAKTRDLQAGSLIGSGTVSNENSSVGSSCLAEKRMIEQIESGTPKTPFMKEGDEVHIWMEDSRGKDLFGSIKQKVVRA